VTSGPSAGSAVVAVVGAGTMGGGIAQVAAVAGHPVTVYNAVKGAAERAVAAIGDRVAQLVAKGRLDCDPAGLRLSVATELGELAPARCVIEAVAEDLAVKQGLFADLEKVVTPDCVLATNTSSLSPTAIAAGLSHPERCRYGDDAPPPAPDAAPSRPWPAGGEVTEHGVSPLRTLLSRSQVGIRTGAGPDRTVQLPSGALLVRCEGKPASALAARPSWLRSAWAHPRPASPSRTNGGG